MLKHLVTIRGRVGGCIEVVPKSYQWKGQPRKTENELTSGLKPKPNHNPDPKPKPKPNTEPNTKPNHKKRN